MSKKRTIATVRQLTLEVNTILPDAPKMSFHKKGMDRYILSFTGPHKDREFGPMSCGEACEFISGIIYSRMEASKLLNKQSLYIDQLEDTNSSAKSNGELKTAERLIQTQQLTIANLTATVTSLTKERDALTTEHHKNAVEQARAMRVMFMAKTAAEAETKLMREANGDLQKYMGTLENPTIGLDIVDEMVGTKQVLECTTSTLGLVGNKYVVIGVDEYRKSLSA